MGISATVTGIGGWTVGPVVARRPAGVARDAVHPGTGARGVLVVVDGRFTGRGLPDAETVARAAVVGSPAVMPMLDAGMLEDGTRWYVTPVAPGPVLDPSAGCSPRRAATIVEAVARALAAVHAAGLVHGLVGPEAVVPALGRHTGRAVGQTLLLDTGVAALLGDRADDLASASGVSLPADRGPAADVHALGALLLRLLTAAAPAGPALAALPVPLRALLSAMLDEHPSRRPTAEAVAATLAGLREGLLSTGAVDLPGTPAAPRRPTAPAVAAAAAPPVSAPVPVVPRQEVVARPVVPAPIPAPLTLESPIVVPRSAPAPAPSLRTGPVRIVEPARPGRRRVKRVLLLAGGVGLAGVLVGVLTHLPLGHHEEEAAVAAAGQNGVFAVPATQSATGSATAASTAAPTHSRSAAAKVALVDATPAFVRPTAVVPSPLAAAATSTTPSRNTTSTKHPSSGSSSGSTASSASSSSSAPASSSSATTSDPVAAVAPSTPTDTSSASSSAAPSTPADSTPTDSSSPSGSATTADPTPSDSSSASDSASASDTASPTDDPSTDAAD